MLFQASIFFSEWEKENEVDFYELEFSIKTMNLEHNHELTFSVKDTFSKEAIDRINICKGKTKTFVDLK